MHPVRDQNAKGLDSGLDPCRMRIRSSPQVERIESGRSWIVHFSGIGTALRQDASEREERPDPIAWSLEPLIRSGGGGDETTTARIGADLKFVQIGIDHAHASHDVVSIKASGELTSTPSWSIRRTRVYELDRDERFVIVLVRRERQAERRVDAARLALPYGCEPSPWRRFRRRRYRESGIEQFIPLHPLPKQ